jgi:futalosine hydrolase
MAHGVLETFGDGRPILIAIAAPLEFKPLARGFAGQDIQMPPVWQPVRIGRWDLLLTGVSKTNAAGAVAVHLNREVHAAVLSIGIGGAYPVDPSLAPPLVLGQTVAGTASNMADEGVQASDSFIPCAKLGFPLTGYADGATAAPRLLDLVSQVVDRAGPIATVSACSGTDQLVEAYRARTGAIAESMEGAAVGVVAHRRSVPFLELRVLSNTTGERARQVWDIPGAVRGLERLASRL